MILISFIYFCWMWNLFVSVWGSPGGAVELMPNKLGHIVKSSEITLFFNKAKYADVLIKFGTQNVCVWFANEELEKLVCENILNIHC